MGAVFPPAWKTHPEFLPWVEGARADLATATARGWNPDLGREDVAAFGAAAAHEFFQKNPDAVSFSLGVNDSLMFGDSAEVKALVLPPKWFRGRPDYSPLVFTFLNRAADRVQATDPGKFIGALAYYWAENAPPFPVRGNVIPFLTADRSQGYDAGFWREEMDLQERWSRAGPKRIGLYDYLYGGGFLVPRVTPHLIAQSLKHAREIGFTDYFAELNPNWGLDGPMPWIVAQLLQDPDASVDALLDEYSTAYFQEAAGPMRRFFARCEEQWLKQPGPPYWLKHYRNASQAVIFPREVCNELRGLLDQAARSVTTELVRDRVAFHAGAFGVTERFVAMEEARMELARKVARRGAQIAEKDVTGYLDRRRGFVRYTKDFTRREPLAFFPINYDDFLKDEPGFEAVVAVAAAMRRATGEGSREKGEGAGRTSNVEHRTSNFEVQTPEARAERSETRATRISNVQQSTSNVQGQAAQTAQANIELRTSNFEHRSTDAGSSGSALVLDTSSLLLRREEPVRVALAAVAAEQAGRMIPVEIDGELRGPMASGRRVAGMVYAMDLPAAWHSYVEPTERSDDRMLSVDGGGRMVRIEGDENTSVFQWVAVQPGKTYVGRVRVRGHVSTSNATTFAIGWLDAKQKNLPSVAVVRLPDGDWPEWVDLRQGAAAPAEAAWVGIGVRVQHQVPGDWAEFAGFELKWF